MKDEPLHALARYIDCHADQVLTLQMLASRCAMSPARLQKRFKAQFGVSPKAYQDAARTRLLKRALQSGERVTDAIYEAGFGSTSRAYGANHELGMALRVYREGGQNEVISHAGCNSALGPLLLAATDRGVCFAQFGASQGQLLEQLAREFPRATLQTAPPSAALNDWLVALDDHLTHRGPSPNLPLDLRGTALQLNVWRFLTGLEPGTTLSYGELAVAVSAPKAVRAVASACARNRVAVLVPCHRVLRADGGMGGYRWGLDRKRQLLTAEMSSTRQQQSQSVQYRAPSDSPAHP